MLVSTLPLPRFDVVRAGLAIRELLRNPDDLPKVFTVIESLSGTAPHRMLFAFRRSEAGARLLREQPDIVGRLADRESLRRLPEGSVGRAYVAFVESEGISAEGIRAASEEGRVQATESPAFAYIHQRMRDTHDLWHAVTGYKGDVLGEAALLGFTLGQHWNSGVALIVLAAILKGYARGSNALILDGFRRGRRAAWLPSQPWESLLARPLDEVRRELRLDAPPVYDPVRTSDLRAEGLVPG